MDFFGWGGAPAEFQLMLLETALRALALGGLGTLAVASFLYFLLWLGEPKRRTR